MRCPACGKDNADERAYQAHVAFQSRLEYILDEHPHNDYFWDGMDRDIFYEWARNNFPTGIEVPFTYLALKVDAITYVFAKASEMTDLRTSINRAQVGNRIVAFLLADTDDIPKDPPQGQWYFVRPTEILPYTGEQPDRPRVIDGRVPGVTRVKSSCTECTFGVMPCRLHVFRLKSV